jgi:hypothetical protein
VKRSNVKIPGDSSWTKVGSTAVLVLALALALGLSVGDVRKARTPGASH